MSVRREVVEMEDEAVLALHGGYKPASAGASAGPSRAATPLISAAEAKRNAAKVPGNQAYCDELKLLQEKCLGNPRKDQVRRTLERARKYILVYDQELTCKREFLAVKGVGDYVAKILVEVRLRTHPHEPQEQQQQQRALARSSSIESSSARPPTSRTAAAAAAGVKRTRRVAAAPKVDEEVDETSNEEVVDTGEPCTPQNCQLVLLLDSREMGANKDRNYFETQMRSRGVEVGVHMLQLGDMVWAVRRTTGSQQLHVCCDTIVERKTALDLAQSIMDGRYQEQRNRILRSGMKRMIYLVEGQFTGEAATAAFACASSSSVSTGASVGTGASAIDTALANTRLAGFWVQETDNRQDTCDFLLRVHTQLQAKLGQFSMTRNNTIEAFSLRSKMRSAGTVQEMFQSMLVQVPGGSADKARAVTQLYPTLRDLMLAYDTIEDGEERDALVKDVTYGRQERKLGPVFSKSLRQCFYG